MEYREVSFEMARKLKELRNEKGLSHEKLRDELNKKYGIEISRDSLINYEIAEAARTRSKNTPNLKMKVVYLLCLADFYEVSIDWLLGISKTRSPNKTVRALCEYSGLTEKAVKRLHDRKNYVFYGDHKYAMPQILSLLLECDDFVEHVIGGLDQAIDCTLRVVDKPVNECDPRHEQLKDFANEYGLAILPLVQAASFSTRVAADMLAQCWVKIMAQEYLNQV